MDRRTRRVGKNEAVFREVNERIRDVTDEAGQTEFLCECGDETCTQVIALTVPEYEAVRTDPRHFAIVPGHEILPVEVVIREEERFSVIEKYAGEATEIAVEHDPRK